MPEVFSTSQFVCFSKKSENKNVGFKHSRKPENQTVNKPLHNFNIMRFRKAIVTQNLGYTSSLSINLIIVAMKSNNLLHGSLSACMTNPLSLNPAGSCENTWLLTLSPETIKQHHDKVQMLCSTPNLL